MAALHRSLMSALFRDPNFPLHSDGRVHHLDVKEGQVANRILCVGDAGRGARIAEHLDGGKYWKHVAPRNFVVYTGTFNKVPVSVVVTLMGCPNTDFVVRELRAVVDGPMAMIRYGTCGGFGPVKPGDVVVAEASIMIRREPDYFRDRSFARVDGLRDPPYSHSISTPVPSDAALTALLAKHMREGMPAGKTVHLGIGASADYFYDSQGRVGTMFVDDNEDLLLRMRTLYPSTIGLEMETFHLLHMARCSKGVIVASGAAIALANRAFTEVVSTEELEEIERKGGYAALSALVEFPLATKQPAEAVWSKL